MKLGNDSKSLLMLTPLERNVLTAAGEALGASAQAFRVQAGQAQVVSRTHSGVGFVTRRSVPGDAATSRSSTNLETLDRLETEARRRGTAVPVHLKVGTGTNRQGVPEPLVPTFVHRIAGSGSFRLAGVSTHFANIEDTTDHRFAEEQLAIFSRIAGAVRETEGKAIRHAACSAAVLLFNRTHFDLARVGISLYGVWPSRETYVSCLERGKPSLDLKPVLSWKSRIAQIKDVPEGGYVG